MNPSAEQPSAGQKLRTMRQKYDWTQLEVSEKLGVDKRTYKRWEQDLHRPGLRQLRRLCILFKSTAEDLGFDSSTE